MITLTDGYGKDAAVLATVADSDAAYDWCRENGYWPLSVRLVRDVWPVARIYDPVAPL